MEIVYTNGEDARFAKLCSELDCYLNKSVGGEKQRLEYNQYNTLELIKDVVLILENDELVACGSFKEYDSKCAEIKRVFVTENNRKKGLGIKIMSLLENRAVQKGYEKLILETGVNLKGAQNMYSKIGFRFIPNYAQYKNMSGSVCMAKEL